MKNTIPHRALGYFLLRATVGAIFLVYSTHNFSEGAVLFAQGLQKDFAATWLAASAVYVFGVVLPFAEFLTGLLLVLGLFTGFAITCAGILLIFLTAGLAILGQAGTVAHNLIFALAVFLLFLHLPDDLISLDRFLTKWSEGRKQVIC